MCWVYAMEDRTAPPDRDCEGGTSRLNEACRTQDVLTCRRCNTRTIDVQIFRCKHYFCGACIVQMWNATTEQIECDRCFNPGNYATEMTDDEMEVFGERIQRDHNFIENLQNSTSEDVSTNHSLSATPTWHPSSASRSRCQSGASNSHVPIEEIGNRPVAGAGASQTRPLYYSDKTDERRIMDNEILNTEQFGFAYVAVQPGTDKIFISDFQNHRIHIMSKEGRHLRTFGSEGNGPGQFRNPRAIVVTNSGLVLVADYLNNRVQILTDEGAPVRQFGSQGTDDNQFWHIRGITWWNEQVYVTDYKKIKIFTELGELIHAFTHDDIRLLYGIAVNERGIYVNDYHHHCIHQFDQSGRLLARIGQNVGHVAVQLCFPPGLRLDDRGYLIVSDHANNRLQIFDPDGKLHSTVKTEDYPWDVAVLSDDTLVISHCRLIGKGFVCLC